MSNRIWFISGVSSGFGKEIMNAAIANGDFVIGTFRKPQQVEEFNKQNIGRAFSYLLDVTDHAAIENCIMDAHKKFGRIDVLVNNAGYGVVGAIEEISMEEARAQMETNFFGSLKLTQTVLPIMRAQKNGTIIQISSGSGIKSSPGFGLYNASKFALEGFSEALAGEVAPLGIRVMIVEPGPFRTQFAGGSIHHAQNVIADYDNTAGQFRQAMDARHGNQEGDPEKAAAVILRVAFAPDAPLRLILGKSAIDIVRAKLNLVQKDLESWESVGRSTTFN